MNELNHSTVALKTDCPLRGIFEGGVAPVLRECIASLGGGEPEAVYLLDFARVSARQRAQLILLVMDIFSVTSVAVETQIEETGFPIRRAQTESVTISFSTRAIA